MRRLIALVAATSLGLCSGCGDDVSPADLDGRTFTSFKVEAGAPLAPQTQLTLRFEDRGVWADAGCNAFGGAYEIKNGEMTADGGMTQMGCAEAVHEQENRFADLLAYGAKVSFDSDRNLRITGGGTTVVLRQTAGR
ncbi:MAG: META domain-containing protein [Solirubrobacteraceae bacterium]|nr:META domain-containing protein [Solirubrobacteraceae bacterium]